MATKGRVGSAVAGSDLRDSSESEPEGEHARTAAGGPPRAPFTYTQVIHSGHFMVSSPHSDASPGGAKGKGRPRYDFDTVNRNWCQTYRYGPRSSGSLSIDPTLTRLFECISLAYSNKIVSPKWKTFKGLRLLWRDKIRLNNAIWRAWFIQYLEKRKNPVCGFVTPLEGSEADAHRKPEAIVLEGSYWKRRIEVVIKEYHKWRIYYKKRFQKKKDGIISMLQEGQICQVKLEKWSSQMYAEPEATTEDAHIFDLDYLLCDISDTLFTMTQKPCPWSSERHNAYTTNADMIQPALTPLQPSLDEFMDIPDICLNLGFQPCDQTGLAHSGYFENSPNVALSSNAPVHTATQLLIDSQLSQAGLTAENCPQASSSNSQTLSATLNQDCDQYNLTPLPFGPQSYADPGVSTLFPANVEHGLSAAVPFSYPAPCHKINYHSPTAASVTPTVITHTASTVGSGQQAPSYPHLGNTYLQTSYHALSHPTITSAPGQTAQTPGGRSHCFAVPEQVCTTEVRGKRKQKRGGARTSDPPPGLSYTTSTAPTSCLAKLLSTGKPSVQFEVTHLTVKGQKSSSPSSLVSSSGHVAGASSQVQHGANWHVALPELHNQSSAQGHRQTSTASAESPLQPDDTAHSSAALLIPKTEKLSPAQLYGRDRSRLTGYPGQTSPSNMVEKSCNPQSPQSGLPSYRMMEPIKPTEARSLTHISAEHKRRFNINMGFDTLQNLVTTLNSQPSIKSSKATTLQKTTEYISKIQQERAVLHDEVQRLRNEVQLLNSAINACQQQLPATVVLNSLRRLSTNTSILTEPRLLPQQATFAVTQGDPSAPMDHSIQYSAQEDIRNM
ncbi:carbohydrate-responsive element-binding protein-like isoform X2 [Syngnathoides biaculeatus]|uniref:carbohydrate-responsive element-binding protein-like isoform X2 n=1 Tax=Syngnathoides biaculeatus TaxID=300417 RepID=UPI002ADD7A42|nr:carbohydrate-responsive element-binding protein-like isoform X2 [Syngnathoides biaculeatus]